MRIISQNVTNYDIPVPDDYVFRINLAWCDSLSELESILQKHKDHKIFLDLPIKRVKPPNNKYTLNELFPIIEKNTQIKYFAISNVESGKDLLEYINKLPQNLVVVPKIESPNAVKNIEDIVLAMKNPEKVLMLDHDDLFSNLIKKQESPDKFKDYINQLNEYCQKNDVLLLRTIGVIFSDEEKRTTQYLR